MRIGWMAGALAAVGGCYAADVTAYITSDGPAVTRSAQAIATSVFQKAGITVKWRRAPGALHIELAARTPEERLPGALAVSYPYAREKRITIFLDRIRVLARGTDRESALLAYVLVHEMTHVIQRVDRHSDSGVMKAHWNAEDHAAIYERRLGFADEDRVLLAAALTRLSVSRSAFRPESQ